MTEGSKSDNSRWVHQIFSNAVDKEDYSAVSVDLLQPISWFFDLYGEDVRHRVCMLDMPLSGAVCLRPEFTIPLAYKFCRQEQASKEQAQASAILIVVMLFFDLICKIRRQAER